MIRLRLVLGILLAVLFSAASLVAQESDTGVEEPELRDELVAMRHADQELRRDYVRRINSEAGVDSTFRARLVELDRRHTRRMKQILDTWGWPGYSLVGPRGSRAAWVLVQHADQDRPFQRRALELLRDAVRAGEASARDMAFLTDRVRKAHGRPQLYGTQTEVVECERVPYPIEDAEHVDRRRQEVGLPPLAEYLEMRRRQLGVGPGCE